MLTIPTAILLSIPLGSLSDRLGRKFIGGIAVMGVFVVMLAYQVVCVSGHIISIHVGSGPLTPLLQSISHCPCGRTSCASYSTPSEGVHLLPSL